MSNTPIPHGTFSGYNYHKCRCEACKETNREYQREYQRKRRQDPKYRARRAETTAKSAERTIARNQRIRQEFLDAGCLDCGSAENLEFHHVDPSTKAQSVSFLAGNTTSVERLLEEIEKCVVVCRPCHLDRHARMRLGLPQEPTSALEA